MYKCAISNKFIFFRNEKLSIVLFSAEWADQCKQVLDAMNELNNQSKSTIQMLNVPAEDLSDVSIKHQIEAVPTVIFFKNGSAVDRIDGVNIPSLTQKCRKLVEIEESKPNLESRLSALIKKSKVMIFMKGSRNEPKCGFSKQLIALINELGVTYDTFDILTDEEVRQGLKKFSDWPTYPQVYVNGELIGGLDIIKEMHVSGDLITTLKA
ncbi:GLRX3 family protein [Megaselia abdita]